MRTFETLSSKEWIDIAEQRRDEVLFVSRATVNLPGLDTAGKSLRKPGYVEYAPTWSALDDRGAAELLVGLGHDLQGHWNRFTILVYRNGGRIFFKSVDSTTLEASIEFQTIAEESDSNP